jgi:uncharacterized alpha-E superfamily protein
LSSLLSRYAECVFWLARQIERANSLARVLDVNETFAYDAEGQQSWETVIDLYADGEEFAKKYDTPSAEAVLYFYLLDRENPGSILSTITQARENARTLRPLISTEMWLQLNTFFTRLKRLRRSDIAEQNLSKICALVKEECQTHLGVTTETFYRDPAWAFYRLGQALERADQTTRLLDVKYYLLLPSAAGVGSAVDVSQWNAVLRSAAGFHAYRRMHPREINPADVTGFLLFDKRFPRSVLACLAEAVEAMTELREDGGLAAGLPAEERLLALSGRLASMSVDDVITAGLHETIDWVQTDIIEIADELAYAFFGAERPASEGQSQSQSQVQSSG